MVKLEAERACVAESGVVAKRFEGVAAAPCRGMGDIADAAASTSTIKGEMSMCTGAETPSCLWTAAIGRGTAASGASEATGADTGAACTDLG